MNAPQISTIITNEAVANGIYKLVLQLQQAVTVVPGQFGHLTVPDAFLRRPLSIHHYCAEHNRVEFLYRVVGEGTLQLSKLAAGTSLDILLPLGNGFSVPTTAQHGLVVGGGIGVAALYESMQVSKNVQWRACFGFRSAQEVLDVDALRQQNIPVFVATEDGSVGHKGFVTGLLEEAIATQPVDIIHCCGPLPMLKAVQAFAMQHNIPTQLSLEERMGCGTGICRVCACKIQSATGWHYLRVCKDGPVFDAKEVVFDE